MNYKDIEWADGAPGRVYRPPTRSIGDNVSRRLPEPQPPVVEEENKAGKKFVTILDQDPEYLQRHAEWRRKFNEEVDKIGTLFALKDLVVPEGWSLEDEVGEEMHYFDPDFAPREGEIGRKLDYIEWHIMGDPVNANLYVDTLRELLGIDMEAVQRERDSFRGEVEGETP